MAIARPLRIEGNLDARRLAEQIEQVCWPLTDWRREILRTRKDDRLLGANWLEWVERRPGTWVDSLDPSYDLFFPTTCEPTGKSVPHPIDLAIYVARAAVRQRALQHIVDLVVIDETILPLGAVSWAAAGQMPGFTPEGMIAWTRRNSFYPRCDWDELALIQRLDPAIVFPKLRVALDQAEAFVNKMPTDLVGLLFLENGKVVQPDPDRLDEYQTHAGQRRGHWPSSSEVESAMLEQYNLKSNKL